MGKRIGRSPRRTLENHMRAVWAEPMRADTELIAIDPGDRWTGVAFFTRNADGEWYCQDAQEFEPHDFEDALAELILQDRHIPPPIIVYEKWRLYGDHAKTQTGSEFLSSQHIGAIKYIVRVHNDHAQRHQNAEEQGLLMTCELDGGVCADPAVRPQPITLVKQGAEIKKPTAGICKRKGIKSVARPISRDLYGGRDHIVDAELHGWKHILDTMGGVAAA